MFGMKETERPAVAALNQIWSGSRCWITSEKRKPLTQSSRRIFRVLAQRDPLTPDIGGKAKTEDMGKAIAAEISTVEWSEYVSSGSTPRARKPTARSESSSNQAY
jgi:hypothetical protein